MIDVTEALQHWRRRVLQSPVTEYPIVWAAHYSGTSNLGEFGIPKLPESENPVGKVIHAGLFPFALSPSVQTSYLVIDEEAVFGARSRRLLVTRLLALSAGVLITHWHCRFGINDRGQVFIGTPHKDMPAHREIWDTTNAIMDQRLALGDTVSFDEAWVASSERFKELMS
jgi:hypothetical protein